MNWLDIVILVVIVVSGLVGLKAGIIKIALSLAGLIVGVILAGRYYTLLSEQLSFISNTNVAKIAAFAIILIVVMIIAGVLAWLLKGLASMTMLSWVNHLAGTVLGLALGAIFCGALLATWVKFLGPAVITESNLAALLVDRFPIVLALLPDEFDAVHSFFR